MIDPRAWTSEELAAYRAEQARRAAPDFEPKKRGKKKSAFERGYFVAWDGEGETEVDGITHRYTYLAAGWYDERGAWHYEALDGAGERLRTLDIFRFMERVDRQTRPDAINVFFASTYDWTHILYDLDPARAWDALAPSRRHSGWIKNYSIKLMPRHELRIARWHRKERAWRIGFWDVFGFFQQSFVGALRSWLGPEYEHLPVIERGKSERGGSITGMARYNEAELIALVDLCRALRDALADAGITIARWDGAGAVASPLYRANLPKGWFERARLLQWENDDVYEALERAYFGGRIEMLRFGTREGTVYHYDIHSAYPAALVTVPDLSAGRWEYFSDVTRLDDLPDFSIVHVGWIWPYESRLTPLPYRVPGGSIYYPQSGEGWYHKVEVQAVADNMIARRGRAWTWDDCTLTIYGAWGFIPDDPDARPFAWVRDLYDLRRELKTIGRTGGAEKAIKLGINSLYGKLAQHAGYHGIIQNIDNPFNGRSRVIINDRASVPPYYNLAAAGYVTAHCRAELLRGALSNPGGVLTLATDGIYSTVPLKVNEGPGLGEWEKTIYPGALWVGVQPGIYYIREQNGRWREMSRGIPPRRGDRQTAIRRRVGAIWRAWRDQRDSLYLRGKRMITLRAALASPEAWAARGCWVPVLDPYTGHEGRRLKVINGSNKRRVIGHGDIWSDPRALTWDRALVPSDVYMPMKHAGQVSEPYDGIPPDAFVDRLEDEEDAMQAWADNF